MKLKFVLFFSTFLFMNAWGDPRYGCDELLVKIYTQIANHAYLEKNTESFFGEELHYLRVGSNQLRKGLIKASKLGSKDAVFLGFSEFGHVYVVVDKMRFDGSVLTTDFNTKKTDILSEGIVIRIEDPGRVISKRILRIIENKQIIGTVTCASGACTLLNGTNSLKIPASFSPLKLFRKIIKHGIKNQKNKDIDYDIIVIGNEPIKNHLKEIKKTIYTTIAQITLPPLFMTLSLIYFLL